MDNTKLAIREKYSQMGKEEKCISDSVLSNMADCLDMTAVDIVKKSGVSSASVIWCVRKLRYDGLEGFESALATANSQNSEWKMVDPITSTDDGLGGLVGKLGVLIGGAMRDFFCQPDKDALQETIDVIKHARKICPMGIGASILSAYDLFHKLKRASFSASYYFDMNVQMESFNYIDEHDVIITFPYSGQSQEILYPCRIAKETKSRVIAAAKDREPVLQQVADICLTAPDKEAVVRIGAFTSLHTSIMMGDLLCLGVIQENLEQIEVEPVKTRKLIEGLKTGLWEGSICGKY